MPKPTSAEKVANKLLETFNDVTLDIDAVATYLTRAAKYNPWHQLYSKLYAVVAKTAETITPEVDEPLLHKVTVTIVPNTPTSFDTRVEILAEFYTNYSTDENWETFAKENDLGLPLAYSLHNNIISNNQQVVRLVNETFDNLLAETGIEDTGDTSLDEILP